MMSTELVSPVSAVHANAMLALATTSRSALTLDEGQFRLVSTHTIRIGMFEIVKGGRCHVYEE